MVLGGVGWDRKEFPESDLHVCHRINFSFKFSVCDGTKPTDLVSTNTSHSYTARTLRIDFSRECTHTHTAHTVFTDYQPQPLLLNIKYKGSLDNTHEIL